MTFLAVVFGLLLLLIILWDTFETIVLPRTVTRRIRFARLYYRAVWRGWASVARQLPDNEWRSGFLGAFGPLSLLVLMGLWAACLVVSFGLIQWGLGTRLIAAEPHPGLASDIYMSGVTLFTLGYGDVVHRTPLGRTLTVIEAGVGIGFLALVIGYLPVIYQAFSRREIGISLLDARAGSPPTAVELLRRHALARTMSALQPFLQEWEHWCADVLESHLSYPVLAYYRSQHDRQSWLASLTTLLDTCALLSLRFREEAEWQQALRWQAQLTYAMGRHMIVDLALIFDAPPISPAADRLPPEEWARLRAALESAGLPLLDSEQMQQRLAAVRRQYEPYVYALAERLLLTLPPFVLEIQTADDWQRSAWESLRHF